jgi:hypothetical protein
VKNLKAILSGIDLATLPAIETPWGFVANRAAGIANSVGDAYTAARYAMDGQWGNAGIDAGEAMLDLIPFAKGKKTYNLSKGATNLPFVYNKLSKVDKAANKALRIGKGMSYADDFHDVVPIMQKGELTKKQPTAPVVNPYMDVDSQAADAFRSMIPLPGNVSQMLTKVAFKYGGQSKQPLERKHNIKVTYK